MNVSRLLASLILLGTVSANAADIGGITVNGEAAFDFNFVSSKNTAIPNVDSATNETYRLNRAQVLLKKETDAFSFLGRLAYAPTSYTDAATTKKNYFGALEQMELFYKVTPELQIGFGRFLTTMGYESLMKYENTFYTPTIAYQTLVPGYGEGLRLKYSPGAWLTVNLSTYNQFNYGAIGEDLTPTKATEFSASTTWGDLTLFAGHLMGTDSTTTPGTNEEKTSSSVWGSYKLMENMMLAITYDSRTNKVEGGTLAWADSTSAVLTYTVGINNLGLRYEMIRNASVLGYGTAEKVNALSITDKIALNDNLNLYVEYRMDTADEEVFSDKDGAPSKNANLVTLGALAHF